MLIGCFRNSKRQWTNRDEPLLLHLLTERCNLVSFRNVYLNALCRPTVELTHIFDPS